MIWLIIGFYGHQLTGVAIDNIRDRIQEVSPIRPTPSRRLAGPKTGKNQIKSGTDP